jgi:protein gp37
MRSALELKKKGIPYKHLSREDRIKMYRTTDAWCEDCYRFMPHAHLERLNQITTRQKPKRIFMDSMFDWNSGMNERSWLDKIIEKMRECSQHTYIILSKRPQLYQNFEFPKNVWLGTSISTHKDMRRVDNLYKYVEDNLRLVSIEPLKGFIERYFSCEVQWIILGAETGNAKGKSPPEDFWIQSIVDNTRDLEIPLFMKKNLEPYWEGELIQEFPEAR